MNKVILVGNVGADPEILRTQDGRTIANIRLATSESWKDKNTGGGRKDDAAQDRPAASKAASKDQLDDEIPF